MCKFTLTSQRIDASIVEGSGIVFCIRFVDFPIYFDLENSSILNNKIMGVLGVLCIEIQYRYLVLNQTAQAPSPCRVK